MPLPVAPDSDQNSPRDHHRPEYSGGPTNARERVVRVCPTIYATTGTLSKYVKTGDERPQRHGSGEEHEAADKRRSDEIETENDSEHGTRGLVSTGDNQPQRHGGGDEHDNGKSNETETETDDGHRTGGLDVGAHACGG